MTQNLSMYSACWKQQDIMIDFPNIFKVKRKIKENRKVCRVVE